MASNTTNLNLYKKDPVTDGSDTFNIAAMLNENWDKIDAAALKAQAAKAALADTDKVPIIDSADSSKTKLVLWSYIKGLFAAAAHSHAWSAIMEKPDSFTPSAHKSTHASGGTDAIAPTDIGAQAAITASGILKGTGSTVSAAARGTDYSLIGSPITATFAVANWALNATTGAYEQNVAVSGLLTTDDQRTRIEPGGNASDPDAQALTDEAYACVDYFACTTAGQLYARSPDAAPTVAFQVRVIIER